jgi:uncharacterized protein (TIGR02145 family)
MAKVNNGYQIATNLVVKKGESTTVYSLLDAFLGGDVVKYGFLYNWWATQDQGGGVNIIPTAMATEGWAVPTDANFTTLATYLGGASVAGGKLKETGTTYWNIPNTGATNEVGFNGRGGGIRSGENGAYGEGAVVANAVIKNQGLYHRTEQKNANNIIYYELIYSTENLSKQADGSAVKKSTGISVRLVRPATAAEQLLDDGAIAATYTGNNGKVYRCTKIGTQVWIADNLAETKWSDGSWIKGYDGGTYTAITDAAWAALTEAALCAYDDDEDNVMMQSSYTALTTQQLAELSEADFNQRVADFKLYVNEQEGFNVFAYETNEERGENTTVCPLPTGCIFVSISFNGGDEITGRVDIKLSSDNSLIHRENIISTDNPTEKTISDLLLINHYAYIAIGLLSEGSLVSSQISWSFDNVNFTTGDTTTDMLPATPCATLYILIEAI